MSTLQPYLLTFTTYGTFLPGDARGAPHRGTREQFPDSPALRATIRANLREAPLVLRREQRLAVHRAITCAALVSGWERLALTVEPARVHAVVALDAPPHRAAAALKAFATAALRRQGLDDGRDRFWTSGSGARALRSYSAVESAICYVEAHPHAAEWRAPAA